MTNEVSEETDRFVHLLQQQPNERHHIVNELCFSLDPRFKTITSQSMIQNQVSSLTHLKLPSDSARFLLGKGNMIID